MSDTKDIKIRVEGDVSRTTALHFVSLMQELVDRGVAQGYASMVFTVDDGDDVAVWTHSTPTMDVFRFCRQAKFSDDEPEGVTS